MLPVFCPGFRAPAPLNIKALPRDVVLLNIVKVFGASQDEERIAGFMVGLIISEMISKI
ncbi:MAG: hypothetical protein ACTTKI_00895 [Tannerella sp.]|uniref:hypothetical protein n=1 Tax=Tannerella sp. TaxID=2382127 RepID=UPI003FA27253